MHTEHKPVIAVHYIVSCYGFWLPNDPRGSWSRVVRQAKLRPFGEATKVNTRRSVAATAHDVGKRFAAKHALQYEPVRLNGRQALVAAEALRDAIDEAGYDVRAFSVMPDHWHMVMRRHAKHDDNIVGHLKSRMTSALKARGMHPFGDAAHHERLPSPWARNFWSVWIHDARHLRTAIRYVRANPVKSGMKPQRWSSIRDE